jgi:predicted nucleic acid-binding protein
VSVLVVDASLVAKWFFPAIGETLVDEAFHLLSQYGAGEIRFLVPDLFWAELGNLFWKRCARSDGRRCPQKQP